MINLMDVFFIQIISVLGFCLICLILFSMVKDNHDDENN